MVEVLRTNFSVSFFLKILKILADFVENCGAT